MNPVDSKVKHVKLRVKFKTKLNIVWGKPLENSKKEAFAYKNGFPGIFYMTDRRAFVIGEFVEKRTLYKKALNQCIYFEVGLQYIKKFELNIGKKNKSGYISFKPHGDIENGVIHFIRLEPNIIISIKEVIEKVKNLRRLREDTGIVILGEDPQTLFKKRLRE
ncbi:MAG: hypothetical protein ACTSWY_03365 [Promethearchaeota archaeon]